MPIGAQKANLTEQTLRFLEEVALNEQVWYCPFRDIILANKCSLQLPTCASACNVLS